MAGKPFQVGVHDCGLWLADWCLEITGRDPAEFVRGHFSTAEELAVLAGQGGLQAIFARELRRIGVTRTRAPVTGDIALITVADTELRGALVSGSNFIVLAPARGVSRLPMTGARLAGAWHLDA